MTAPCKRMIDVNDSSLLDALAEAEHIQWAHWTRYMLANLTPENMERWKRQVEMPYAELNENEKGSDREWARKALLVMDKWWWRQP